MTDFVHKVFAVFDKVLSLPYYWAQDSNLSLRGLDSPTLCPISKKTPINCIMMWHPISSEHDKGNDSQQKTLLTFSLFCYNELGIGRTLLPAAWHVKGIFDIIVFYTFS